MATPFLLKRIPSHFNYNPAGGELPLPGPIDHVLPPDVRLRHHANKQYADPTHTELEEPQVFDTNTYRHAKGPLYGEGFTQGRWKGFD